MTARDVKRPKERARDREYKQRFSKGSSTEMAHGSPPTPPSLPLGGHRWPREDEKSERTGAMVDSTSLRDQPSRFQDQRLRRSVSPTSLKRENTVSGPPRLDPNAVVMVFFVPPSLHLRRANDDDGFRPPNVGQGF